MEYNSEIKNRTIREMHEDERPRERLITFGAKALKDEELLAILISSGGQGNSAIDIAKQIIANYQNISGLANVDFSALRKIKGIGSAKAITLCAAIELGRRIIPAPNKNQQFRSPEDVASYYIRRFANVQQEHFVVILLNAANQMFREVEITKGTLNASLVHPREVFKVAISESAAAIILLHNHPSGNREPSQADKKITQVLTEAGKILDIKVLDHIIVAGSNYFSFSSAGLM